MSKKTKLAVIAGTFFIAGMIIIGGKGGFGLALAIIGLVIAVGLPFKDI